MKTPADTRRILDALEGQHPGADTELHYKTPFDLLVATILSAQSTDARVNMVTQALLGMARALVDKHGGEVPADMDALVDLPGVGRKTANVVLGHALGVPGLPVDRHVLRVSNRIGIAESDDPVAVERQLCRAMPKARWTRTSDTLILHGRRICRPRPLCDQCAVRDDCDYFATVVSRARGTAKKTRAKKNAKAVRRARR
jgi:endonuclease-3